MYYIMSKACHWNDVYVTVVYMKEAVARQERMGWILRGSCRRKADLKDLTDQAWRDARRDAANAIWI